MEPRNPEFGILDIPFPSRGLDKGMSVREQPPQTTVDAMNVRPYTVGDFGLLSSSEFDTRRRGGTRPALVAGYTTLFGAPIRLLHPMQLPTGAEFSEFTDTFESDEIDDEAWSPAEWVTETKGVSSLTSSGTSCTATVVGHGYSTGWIIEIAGADQSAYNGTFEIEVVDPDTFTYTALSAPSATPATGTITADRDEMGRIYPDDQSDLVYNERVGMVYKKVEFDTSKPYEITLNIVPFDGQHWGKYSIFSRLDNDNPDGGQNGVIVEVTLSGTNGTYSGNIYSYEDGVQTQSWALSAGALGQSEDAVLKVVWEGGRIIVFLDSTSLANVVIGEFPPVGHRVGFGMEAIGDGAVTFVDTFTFRYFDVSSDAYTLRHILVASAGGRVYRETNSTVSMDQVSTNTTLNSDVQLQATALDGVLYIADYSEPKIEGSTGLFLTDGKQLTATTVGNWLLYGIEKDSDLVEITNGTGAVEDGVYRIDQVVQDKVVLRDDVGGTGTATFRILRGPKKFRVRQNVVEFYRADTDKGYVPIGCPLICSYRGRVVMAGASHDPSRWFMSRQGDPDDWDYSETDSQAAINGESSAAGAVGDALTALVPYLDDALIFATASSLWMLRGDPGFGGQLNNLSRTAGIAGIKAWCHGAPGTMYFMSYDGFYLLNGPNAQNLSKMPLPDVDLNVPDDQREEWEFILEYDRRDRGVHIFIVQTRATASPKNGKHFWWDERAQGFWPMSFNRNFEPCSITALNERWGKDSPVVLGCRDGRLRAFRDAILQDNLTENIGAHVVLGPFFVAEGQREVILTEVTADIPEDSKDVKWEVFVGDSPEEAYKGLSGTAFASGILGEGSNKRFRPRARARAFFIKLSNGIPTVPSGGVSSPWGLERLHGKIKKVGLWRIP